MAMIRIKIIFSIMYLLPEAGPGMFLYWNKTLNKLR